MCKCKLAAASTFVRLKWQQQKHIRLHVNNLPFGWIYPITAANKPEYWSSLTIICNAEILLQLKPVQVHFVCTLRQNGWQLLKWEHPPPTVCLCCRGSGFYREEIKRSSVWCLNSSLNSAGSGSLCMLWPTAPAWTGALTVELITGSVCGLVCTIPQCVTSNQNQIQNTKVEAAVLDK